MNYGRKNIKSSLALFINSLDNFKDKLLSILRTLFNFTK